MTWVLLALAAVLYLTQTEQGQKLSENLGLDKLLPVGTPILPPPGTPPPATTPSATVPGGTVTLPDIQQPAPTNVTVGINVPSSGAYPVPVAPPKIHTGPDRSGATTPPFRIPDGVSSAQWLQTWVRQCSKITDPAASLYYSHTSYVLDVAVNQTEMAGDFAVKVGPAWIEPDGRLYYDYLNSIGWRVATGTLNGIPYMTVAGKGTPGSMKVAIKGNSLKGGFRLLVGARSCMSTDSFGVQEVHREGNNITGREGIPKNSLREEIDRWPTGHYTLRRLIYTGNGKLNGWTDLGQEIFRRDGSPCDYGEMACRIDPNYHLKIGRQMMRTDAQNNYSAAATIAYWKERPWLFDYIRRTPQAQEPLLAHLISNNPEITKALTWIAQQAGLM